MLWEMLEVCGRLISGLAMPSAVIVSVPYQEPILEASPGETVTYKLIVRCHTS